jgi:hypothetical protein
MVFLFVLIGKYFYSNNQVNGDGRNFYFGYKDFPLPVASDAGVTLYYDVSQNQGRLIQDAYQ